MSKKDEKKSKFSKNSYVASKRLLNLEKFVEGRRNIKDKLEAYSQAKEIMSRTNDNFSKKDGTDLFSEDLSFEEDDKDSINEEESEEKDEGV